MVNKTKCFPKLIPTNWHKPVYLNEIQTKYCCLHYIGSLGCLWKKELTKFCKGNVFFYKYVHMIIRLQMKSKFFFCILKQIMYFKIYTFFNIVFKKTP